MQRKQRFQRDRPVVGVDLNASVVLEEAVDVGAVGERDAEDLGVASAFCIPPPRSRLLSFASTMASGMCGF
jgi:hypothetical protein